MKVPPRHRGWKFIQSRLMEMIKKKKPLCPVKTCLAWLVKQVLYYKHYTPSHSFSAHGW